MPRMHKTKTREEMRNRAEKRKYEEMKEFEQLLEDHYATNTIQYKLPSKLGGANKDGKRLRTSYANSNDSLSADNRGVSPTPSVTRTGNRPLQTSPTSARAVVNRLSAKGTRRPPSNEKATPTIEHTCKRDPGFPELCTDELTFVYDLVHFLKERGEQEKARCVEKELIKMNGIPMDWYSLYVQVVARCGGIARGHGEASSEAGSLFDDVDFQFAEEVFPCMRNSHGCHMEPEDIHRTLMEHYLDYLLDYERAHPQDVSKEACFYCGKFGVYNWESCAHCKKWLHLKCDSKHRKQNRTNSRYSMPFTCARCSPEGTWEAKEKEVIIIDSDSEEQELLSDAAHTDASVKGSVQQEKGPLGAAMQAAIDEAAAEPGLSHVSRSDGHEEGGDEDSTAVAAAMRNIDALLRDPETNVFYKNGEPNSTSRGQESDCVDETHSVEDEQAVAATASDNGACSSPVEAPAPPDNGAESTEKSWSGTTMQVISDSAERISDQFCPARISPAAAGIKEKLRCQSSADRHRPKKKISLTPSFLEQLDERLYQTNITQAARTTCESQRLLATYISYSNLFQS